MTVLLLALLSACNSEGPVTDPPANAPALPALPPTPLFNRDSAYAFVAKQVSFGPRVPGTPPHTACADLMVAKLKGYGAQVIEQRATVKAFNGKELPLRNIIARFDTLEMGLYIYTVRKGTNRGIREASILGVVLLVGALVLGKSASDSSFAEHLKLSKTALTLGMATYGFVASVLPVWMLLCPRDYLSSYLKIGTIALLVVGVVVVNPRIEMPAVIEAVHGGGPVVKGPLFPFIFITIACGAISGFHALVASGTTPKMVDKERDCRPIAYGAMLMEGLVGITALIAACAMP